VVLAAEPWPVEFALVIGPVADHVVMTLMVVVIPGPMGMALVVVVMFEPTVIARLLVMVLVILESLVMLLMVVVMAGLVVYALVLPPTLVIVVLARYGLKQPKVIDQPLTYLVYAIEWCCQHILQGNFSHLQRGCLSCYPRSLISRVAPLVHMH